MRLCLAHLQYQLVVEVCRGYWLVSLLALLLDFNTSLRATSLRYRVASSNVPYCIPKNEIFLHFLRCKCIVQVVVEVPVPYVYIKPVHVGGAALPRIQSWVWERM